MKRLIIIFLTIALVVPLYAQEAGYEDDADILIAQDDLYSPENEAEGEAIDGEIGEDIPENVVQHQPGRDLSDTRPFNFAREKFEIGIDAGAGFDNDLMSMGDIFTKNVVLDLDKLGSDIGDDGLNLNLDVLFNFFINVRMGYDWGFGFFTGVDGGISGTLPKSMLTLITDGNINNSVSSGTISASGSVFANVGLTGFMQLPETILDGKLRVGVSPAVFVPVIYIPGSSGIWYVLDTGEGIKLDSGGSIDVYSMFSMNPDSSGDVEVSTGFDISLEAEYANPFPFIDLDLGVSLSHIPIVAGALQYQMQYVLKDGYYERTGQQMLDDGLGDLPDVNYDEKYNDNVNFEVYRPFRFDTYAVYRPLSSKLLVLKTNMGFTVDITDSEGYFNTGVEVQTTVLNNMIFAYLATNYVETIWSHRLGVNVNFRAFELDLEGALRSYRFLNSFTGAGYGVQVGLRFGW